MPTLQTAISSRVTHQNPRPRKYATAAERQKALRERYPTLCVRVEQKQADFMRRIAELLGRSVQDVHLAFIKYASGRGNQWLIQGLSGFKPLPQYKEPPKENPTMKRKPTPAQIAARERFAEMARSGAFKKKAKRNPAKKTALRNKVKSNPSGANVAQTILAQLGGNRFIAMTGAKDFIAGSQFLGFKIPRNMSQANRVTITYAPSRDLYSISFIKTARSGFDTKEIAKFEDVYANQLRPIFTQVTGMETSLGTMGRRNNPRASNPMHKWVVYYTGTRNIAGEVMAPSAKAAKEKVAEKAGTVVSYLKASKANPGNPRGSNPQARTAKRKGSIANPNYRYAVQAGKYYTPGQKTMSFVNVAGFPTKAQAQDYIDALLKTYPKGLTLRIMESKVE